MISFEIIGIAVTLAFGVLGFAITFMCLIELYVWNWRKRAIIEFLRYRNEFIEWLKDNEEKPAH